MVAYRCVCITHPFIHHRCVAAEKQQHHSLKIKNVAESIKRNLNAALPQVCVITLLLLVAARDGMRRSRVRFRGSIS